MNEGPAPSLSPASGRGIATDPAVVGLQLVCEKPSSSSSPPRSPPLARPSRPPQSLARGGSSPFSVLTRRDSNAPYGVSIRQDSSSTRPMVMCRPSCTIRVVRVSATSRMPLPSQGRRLRYRWVVHVLRDVFRRRHRSHSVAPCRGRHGTGLDWQHVGQVLSLHRAGSARASSCYGRGRAKG